MIKSICVFGDSIAYGRSDLEVGGWVTRLKLALLTDTKDYTAVLNFGIPADLVAKAVDRIKPEVEYCEPELSFLALGVNDTPHTSLHGLPTTQLRDFKRHYAHIIKVLQKNSNRICLIGITNVHPNNPWRYSNDEIQRYNKIVTTLAQKKGIDVIETFGLLDPSTDFTKDGVHPNGRGHKKIFEKVLPVAKRLVENNR